MELIGRRAETAALDRLLAGAAEGAGSGLVLWGEPGIGKTALLDYAVGSAPGVTVLRCRGTRVEAGLAFAALHELLWPVVDRVATLPEPQAAALRGALGLSQDAAGRFLIGAAVLSLVSELAARRPVLVVVDDAQWIDEATAYCLGFLARRVGTEPVAVLLTAHTDPASGPWEGLPALAVTGLGDEDARTLVAATAPGADPALVDDVVRTAEGNPLALHELPTLDRAVGGGAPAPPSAELVPVGPRLRRAFCAQVAGMTEPAQTLLLLAAAEGRGDRGVVGRAGAAAGVDESTWDEVLGSGLLRASGPRVEFRHPLIPAALYDGAAFRQRQAAHRALAAALPAEAIEERAWHLATAADGADEQVAVLLERAAAACLRRSAGPMAARTLRRAAELSPAPGDAARRLARAARAAWDAGQADVARRLLDDAVRLGVPGGAEDTGGPGGSDGSDGSGGLGDPDGTGGTDGEALVARAAGGLRGILEFAHGRSERAHHYLARDMQLVARARDAVELGAVAVRAAWSAGRTDLQLGALRRLLAVDAGGDAELAAQLPVLRTWWSCYDETGGTTLPAAITGSSGSTVPAVPAVPAVPTGSTVPLPDGADDPVGRLGTVAWELLPPVPLVQAWGVEGPLLDVLHLQAGQLRRRHELAALAVVLSQTAVLDLAAGRWDAAETGAAEGLRLAEEAGVAHVATQCRASLGYLAAARGDRAGVAEYTAAALRVSVPHGVRALTAATYWHRGRAALFTGRPQDALPDLAVLAESGHEAAQSTFALLAAPDTAEAAVQAGRPDVAEARLAQVQDWAGRTGAAWARAAVHRLHALVRGGPGAEDDYRAALDEPGAADQPFELARTRLLYGEWLRRARRRADARDQLAAADEVFARLGAEPLRARALREQDLTDTPAARRAPGPPGGLTAQELRVARLAADRLTNREIAAQLLISPRTVGHHLASVYPKLGITSRGELARIDLSGDLRLRVDARGS